MKIVIYSKHCRKLSGVQTFEKNLIRALKTQKNAPEIIYMYDISDIGALEEYKDLADNVIQNTQQSISCDACIFSSIYIGDHKIQAQKYIQVHHTNYRDFHVRFFPNNTYQHVAVSEPVQKMLKEEYNTPSTLIHNIVDIPKPTYRVLRLITVSRIAKGKGFERMHEFAKLLQDKGVPYTWEVYGSGSYMYQTYCDQLFSDTRQVQFLGEKSSQELSNYISEADYLVQLSDSEGFCYSMHEALMLSVSVIVNRWKGVEEWITPGTEGYILEPDLSNAQDIIKNINIEYTKDLRHDIMNVKKIIQQWFDILSINNSYNENTDNQNI